MLDILAGITPETEKIIESVAIKASQEGHTVIYWLIGFCITGVLGLYAFMISFFSKVNGELGKIYESMNKHMRAIDIHPNIEKLVSSEVCKKEQELSRAELKNIDEKVNTVKQKVDSMDNKLDQVLINLVKD